jgi:nicotinate-nucleotide--dimethylbenzimidazole phosphoribosyltransferase
MQPDTEALAAVAERAAQVLRPSGAFARLDAVAAWLAGWQRTTTPCVDHPAVLLFAADHGVAATGVSAYPQEVTAAMVAAFRSGIATSTVLARVVGATVEVIDVGVGDPTGDITITDAMDHARFERSWTAGVGAVEALPATTDLLVVGEMGIGNTTAAAAVAASVLGGDATDWVGRGTGVDDAGLARKHAAVSAAVQRIGSSGAPVDPLVALQRVGGAELVALAGAIAAARRRSLAVLLDGFIVTAAALGAGPLDHCLAAHRSGEQAHGRLLTHLGLDPLLDLDLRLGEGSGALVALPIVRLACAAVVEVATFGEAGLLG